MAEVYLDGEQVRFDGPFPTSFSELLAVLERGVAASGRVLVGVSVDGSPSEGELDEAAFGGARRIEFLSLSVAEAIQRLAGSCRERASGLLDRLAPLSVEVLREPWPSVASQLVASGEPLAALLNDLGNLGEAAPYSAWAHDLSAALGTWLDAVTARDAAGVCLALEKAVLPCLRCVAGEAKGEGDA